MPCMASDRWPQVHPGRWQEPPLPLTCPARTRACRQSLSSDDPVELLTPAKRLRNAIVMTHTAVPGRHLNGGRWRAIHGFPMVFLSAAFSSITRRQGPQRLQVPASVRAAARYGSRSRWSLTTSGPFAAASVSRDYTSPRRLHLDVPRCPCRTADGPGSSRFTSSLSARHKLRKGELYESRRSNEEERRGSERTGRIAEAGQK